MNKETPEIDTGDIVLHKPSDERWVVAFVRDGKLCACGWPESVVPLRECELVSKASPEDRLELLDRLSRSDGARGEYARSVLAPPAPAPSMSEASPPEHLKGDARQAWLQCKAVAHMARSMVEVHEGRALILEHDQRLADVIGSSTAAFMETLGDGLESMDAYDPAADEWMDPIFEVAQARWPVRASLPSAATPQRLYRTEAEATDELLVMLFPDLQADDLRTDGGNVNMPKVRSLLRDRATPQSDDALLRQALEHISTRTDHMDNCDVFNLTDEDRHADCTCGFDSLCAALRTRLASPLKEREPLTEEQIRDGWLATFSTNNPFCPCDLHSFTKAARWAERTINRAGGA